MATSKPTDRHTHTHFRNAVPLPWGSLRLAPIKRNLECARRNNPQVDKLEQAREGNANEDHFANTQLLQITIQKCARNVNRTIKVSDIALPLTELVESFVTAIFHPQRARLRASVHSLLHTCIGNEIRFLLPFIIL